MLEEFVNSSDMVKLRIVEDKHVERCSFEVVEDGLSDGDKVLLNCGHVGRIASVVSVGVWSQGLQKITIRVNLAGQRGDLPEHVQEFHCCCVVKEVGAVSVHKTSCPGGNDSSLRGHRGRIRFVKEFDTGSLLKLSCLQGQIIIIPNKAGRVIQDKYPVRLPDLNG